MVKLSTPYGIRRKLRTSSTDALKAKFRELRANVKKMVNASRNNFFSSLDINFQLNPKRFWSIFKLSTKESSIPETMSMGKADRSAPLQTRSASTPTTIAEIFNTYFTSVFTCSDFQPSPPSQPPAPDLVLSDVHLTTEEVLNTLLALDTNKATGPDGIPPKLLKETAQQIAPSLTQLFNKSLSCGVLPDDWKLANIVPVHKKGEKDHVENYRPISLLPVISKVLERCVLSNIRDHLLVLINDTQHGFIPGKSCTSQLVEVLDYIGSLLDAGKQTDIVYMDMSKAFDKVNHQALINKLYNCFGISGNLLGWFCSYLLNRRQRVTVLGATSSEKPVLSGVPQGSILGPILFLLYVNDLPDSIKYSKVASFADDTKIFKCVDSTTDAALIQRDLSSLENWSTTSGLVFNQDKCKCQRITRKMNPTEYPYEMKSKTLVVTQEEKDLGIWVTSALTWSKHTLDRCATANKMLGFLRRSASEITNEKIRRTLYLSVVRPALGYATQVWSPQSVELIKRTERIQRRASKFILKLPFMCEESYRDRLVTTELLPLSYWHEYLDILFFFKAINGIVSISSDILPERFVPLRLTRSSANVNAISFRQRKCKTTTYNRSFFIRTTRTWNSLPEHLRLDHLSFIQFKKSLLGYYNNALLSCYNVNDPRTWKTVCLKCNTSRSLSQPITCCY